MNDTSGSSRDDDATRTAAHAMLPSGTVLAQRYRIERFIGLGGMGMVYRATDMELDVTVALKILRLEHDDASTLERFRREIVLARQVTHPNVVRIHDIGHDQGHSFLTMDYVDGVSLRQHLDSTGPLPLDEALRIAGQLAEALAAAHDEGVVHRDLKPANILLDGDGRAYVSDFGIARSLNEAGATHTGMIVGTPDYLAPEQARGEPVDGRADIYALGLILYELLSGERPFGGDSFAEKLAARIQAEPRDIALTGARVPAGVRKIIGRCLAREPARRYPDARALAQDLERREAGSRPWPWKPALAAGLVIVALAGAGLAVRHWFGGTTPVTTQASKRATAIAVLPLDDQTGRPELRWVSRGVAEMLTNGLADSPGLQVVDSLRVFRTLDEMKLDPANLSADELEQLADLLDADRIIRGRVRSLDSGLRIELQTSVPGNSGETSRELHATASDSDALYATARQLDTQLLETFRRPPPAQPETALSDSPAAMQAYSKGVDKLLEGDSVNAAPALEKAVQADPHFAAAWLRLSGAYESLGFYDKAIDAASRTVAELGQGKGRLALEAQAREARLKGQPQKAQTLLKQLTQRFPKDVEARVELAEAYGAAGDYANARASLETVVSENPNHPRAWYLLGKFAILSGDSHQAIDDYLVHALVIQNRLDNDQGRADVMNAMGIAYNDIGKLDDAREQYRKAIALRRKIGDRRGVAAALSNLARVEEIRGDYPAARDRIGEALTVLNQLGDRDGVAGLRNELGILAEEQGNYPDALKHFREALQIRKTLGDQRALAESYNNVGYVYYVLGQYDNADLYASQSRDLYRKTQNPEGEMIATQTIGVLEIARANWDRALKSFLHSLETARKLDMSDAIAVSQSNLGRIAFYQGRYAAALQSYADALKQMQARDDPRGLIEFTLYRADLELDLGMNKAASDDVGQAVHWLADGSNQEQSAHAARLQAVLAMHVGDTAKAGKLLDTAMQSATASGSRKAILDTRLAQAELARRQGDLDRARALASGVGKDATDIGHRLLQLQSGETLAAAQLDAGMPQQAATTLRKLLDLAKAHAPYGREYCLQRLLARALESQNDSPAAQAAWQAAEKALDRVRDKLSGDQRQQFDTLPEVVDIERHHASRS